MIGFLSITALIGATLIVSSSTLFGPIRTLWPSFLGCAQCVGFWVGATAGATILTLGHSRAVDAIIVGCATSFLSLLGHGVICFLLDGIIIQKDDDDAA